MASSFVVKHPICFRKFIKILEFVQALIVGNFTNVSYN